jgi:enoyl-CoA hydratase
MLGPDGGCGLRDEAERMTNYEALNVKAGYETLAVHVDGYVAEVRMNRPELQNRFDDALHRELAQVIAGFNEDASIRAVLWTAEGKHFSAGGDMDSILAGNADFTQLMAQIDAGRRLYRAFADLSKPLIVALQGHTFGVATSLILTADAVVTMPTVRISDPHVHMGLVAGDGGVVGWPANLAFVRAKRHLLWGEPISGADAHQFGMVTELAQTPDEVLETAWELARRVSSLPPVAVQLTKRALNKQFHTRIDDVFDTAFYLEALSATTHDVREAVAAFREKRTGEWSGK